MRRVPCVVLFAIAMLCALTFAVGHGLAISTPGAKNKKWWTLLLLSHFLLNRRCRINGLLAGLVLAFKPAVYFFLLRILSSYLDY
jgi:hypothetical protein